MASTIQLPEDKFNELQLLLKQWGSRKKCTKRELLSLIGSFACKVVKSGRMFLRRLIDLSTSVPNLNHHITLNSEARADIQWWNSFLHSWNGIEFIQQDIITSHSLKLFTDASFLGFGAVYRSHWFSIPWPSSFSQLTTWSVSQFWLLPSLGVMNGQTNRYYFSRTVSVSLQSGSPARVATRTS